MRHKQAYHKLSEQYWKELKPNAYPALGLISFANKRSIDLDDIYSLEGLTPGAIEMKLKNEFYWGEGVPRSAVDAFITLAINDISNDAEVYLTTTQQSKRVVRLEENPNHQDNNIVMLCRRISDIDGDSEKSSHLSAL